MTGILDDINECYAAISRVMNIISANTVRGTSAIMKQIGNRPRLPIDGGYHVFSNGFAIGSPVGGSYELSPSEMGKIEVKTADLPWMSFEFDLQADQRGEVVLEAMFDAPPSTPIEVFMRVFTAPGQFDDQEHARRLVETGVLMVCTLNYAPLPPPSTQKVIVFMPNPPMRFEISRLATVLLA